MRLDLTYRPATDGHTATAFKVWRDALGRHRASITCECGKRYTGFGSRASRSHTAHRDAALAAA